MSGKRGHLMPAEVKAKIAHELVAIAPGAPYLLRRAAGMGLDSASGQPLGLESQQPTTPEGSIMNKQRRKDIAEIASRIEALIAQAEEAKGDLENVRDEEQEYYDNMPDSIRDGDKGQAADEAIRNLDDAISALEDLTGGDLVSSLESAAE